MADKNKSDDDQILFSEEYVTGKEKKPSKKEIDQTVESIFSFPSTGLEEAMEKDESYAEYAYGRNPPYYSKKSPLESPKVEERKEREVYEDLTKLPGYAPPKEAPPLPAKGLANLPERYVDTEQEILARRARENKWKKEGKWDEEEEVVVDAEFTKEEKKKLNLNPIDAVMGAKGYASEQKLKWEASRYGILPSDFDKLKKTPAGLQQVKQAIIAGRKGEKAIERSEMMNKKTKAEIGLIEAASKKRYAEAEKIEATVPTGGRKLVQFGSTNFGQTPIYVNAAGTHGQIRSQYVPGQMSGVSTALANSRLEIARMKQRVLGGTGGNYSAVQALMPNQQMQGGSIISRLAGNTGYPKPPPGAGSLGAFKPSVLQKLGALRRRRP